MQDQDRWLTIDETAELIGVARGTLAQMRLKKTGPRFAKPSPRLVRYLASDVEAWLQAGFDNVEAAA